MGGFCGSLSSSLMSCAWNGDIGALDRDRYVDPFVYFV
jgi:hypothetical protein